MKSPLILRIFKSNQLVGVKQFDQDQIVIGHNAEVHLDLDSDQISPIHCLIELRDNGYYICDLGSHSGTFKNGQAILDEMISSGDEISAGPFKIAFFIGVPKPKTMPGKAVEPDRNKGLMPIAEEPKIKNVEASMPPAQEVKKEEIVIERSNPQLVKVTTPAIPPVAPKVDEKPVIAATPLRPEIKPVSNSYKKIKKTKSFAPPSEIQNLKSHLRPGKGGTVEVIVAWKERILSAHHFQGSQVVRVNSGTPQEVVLPEGLVPRGYPLIDVKAQLRVNVTPEMKVEMISSSGEASLEDLSRAGKVQKGGFGHLVQMEQNEMLCVALPGGNVTLYIRFVPQAPVVALAPMMLSKSELTSIVMAFLIVGLLALYISSTTPSDWQETKQEEVQYIAQVIFDKPPVMPTPPPVATPTPTPTPPPPEVKPTPTPTPTPTPKKVLVTEQEKKEQVKGKKGEETPQKAQVAARANEVAPKPNAQDRTKRFTSTRQGGAIKTGETAGANAQSAKKDLSKVGLFSAFGGGGSRANIDKAYSGAGEVLGMADKATGTSGSNESRAGNDLGSKFKDSGAGGKGTATQGIAGIGTKGRSSGQSAYGASEGLAGKTTVAIEGGGFEESFDATIDKEAIRRVIRTKIHEVKSCYERALNVQEKGKRLEGKIVLGWEIVDKGQARNVKVKSSTLDNPQVENCIRDRLASWTFPEPPPGLVAEVQAYPFVLNQAN